MFFLNHDIDYNEAAHTYTEIETGIVKGDTSSSSCNFVETRNVFGRLTVIFLFLSKVTPGPKHIVVGVDVAVAVTVFAFAVLLLAVLGWILKSRL